MSPRAKPPALTYHSLEEDPSCEHPIDRAVRLRVRRRDLERVCADASTQIVKALGRQKKIWFTYEAAADELRAKREAAYFDVGVEHGIAACAANGLGKPNKNVRALAEQIVQDLLGTEVARHDAAGAAIVAAWAMLGGKADRPAKRPTR